MSDCNGAVTSHVNSSPQLQSSEEDSTAHSSANSPAIPASELVPIQPGERREESSNQLREKRVHVQLDFIDLRYSVPRRKDSWLIRLGSHATPAHRLQQHHRNCSQNQLAPSCNDHSHAVIQEFKSDRGDIPTPGTENTIEILHGISGRVMPGTLLAILGPSGSGKTTLVDILANRKSFGQVSGQILINGVQHTRVLNYKSYCSYVTQEDVLVPTATAFETLKYYADLRLPRTTTETEKRELVLSVLSTLGLEQHEDSWIGGVIAGGRRLPGLSGGERRRLMIGTGLVTNPSILILDEPTSGLDAASAYVVMDYLVSLARGGRTVICTIHQERELRALSPRSKIFQRFDELMVLGKGFPIYLGKPLEVIKSIEPFYSKFDGFTNPADYVLDFVATLSWIDVRNFVEHKRVHQDDNLNAANNGTVQLRSENGSNSHESRSSSQSGSRSSSVSANEGDSSAPTDIDPSLNLKCEASDLHDSMDCDPIRHAATAVAQPVANRCSWPPNEEEMLQELPPQHQPHLYPNHRHYRSQQQPNQQQSTAALSSNDATKPAHTESSDALGQSGGTGNVQADDGPQCSLGNSELELPKFVDRLGVLTRRAGLMFVRNIDNVLVRFITAAIVAIMIGLPGNSLQQREQDIPGKLSMMYSMGHAVVILPFAAVSLFVASRVLFNAERASGLYRMFEYYVANTVWEYLVIAVNSIAIVTIVYWTVHLNPELNRFLFAVLSITIMHLIADSMIISLTNLMANQDMAFALGGGIMVIWFIYSGYFFRFSTLPRYVAWIRWVNPLRYCFESLVINEFSGVTYPCDAQRQLLNACLSGERVIAAIGFDPGAPGDKWGDIWIMLLFLLQWHALAYVFLKYLHKERR